MIMTKYCLLIHRLSVLWLVPNWLQQAHSALLRLNHVEFTKTSRIEYTEYQCKATEKHSISMVVDGGRALFVQPRKSNQWVRRRAQPWAGLDKRWINTESPNLNYRGIIPINFFCIIVIIVPMLKDCHMFQNCFSNRRNARQILHQLSTEYQFINYCIFVHMFTVITKPKS